MLPLLVKPTGQIDFVLETALVLCSRYDKEEGELQVFLEESLSLQIVAEEVQSLLYLAIRFCDCF